MIKVHIRNLAVGGAGVGNVTAVSPSLKTPSDDPPLEGITAFVPFTIPGEDVWAHVDLHKKRYLEARLAEVISPAAGRVTPRCCHFGICGGCELQHMSYATQLESKHAMIRSMLQVGGCGEEILSCLEAIVPSQPFNYRRRIALHLDPQANLGFYRSRSREVISLNECPISDPQIGALLPKLSHFAKAVCHKISTLILECDSRGVCAVLRTLGKLTESDLESLRETTQLVFDSASIQDDSGERLTFGRRELTMPTLDGSVEVPVGAFSQINAEVNLQLVNAVCEELSRRRVSEIWDLYAGAGNFALPLARRGFSVTAVEVDPRLVEVGKREVPNYVCSSVEAFLRGGSVLSRNLPDAIVADPPRSGLGNLVKSLPEVERLILISCHLPSFVRDLKNLINGDWRVSRIVPFDMFAQTSYVEMMSVFIRK